MRRHSRPGVLSTPAQIVLLAASRVAARYRGQAVARARYGAALSAAAHSVPQRLMDAPVTVRRRPSRPSRSTRSWRRRASGRGATGLRPPHDVVFQKEAATSCWGLVLRAACRGRRCRRRGAAALATERPLHAAALLRHAADGRLLART